MTIDPASAAAVEYDDRTYYFCESACADTFRDEPERWMPRDTLVEA
jgi:YHS domain-containing protein